MTEAETLYAAYKARRVQLDVLRHHARAVVAATGGNGQTPVEPLATMNRGGALVCDVCGEPMLLEGGADHGKPVDVAWRANPRPRVSWILHGVVLRIETNGTLRVYHGYIDRSGCVLEADRMRAAAKDEFRRTHDPAEVNRKLDLLAAELKLSDGELSDVLATMFSYDPGIGANAP